MQSLINPQLLKTKSYINGQWHNSQDKFEVLNPATNTMLAEVENATTDDLEIAIAAAKNALPSWSAKSANERASLMLKWFDLMMEHQSDLAKIITLEQGKPLAESTGEIGYGAAFIEWFAHEGKRAYGDIIPTPSSDKRVLVIKQPVGVVASVTPWNFPNAMITRKAAAALGAGCTFVSRPSEKTPLSALAMAHLADLAGIPDGVFNVVIGTDAIGMGKILTEHPDIAKFTFTGSTQVGKKLISQCASSVKKVSMELGGNAPFIVFNDADIDAAVEGAIASKYRNSGQTCVCSNRLFVHRDISEQFTQKLIQRVKLLKQGNGLDKETTLGPMIDERAIENVHNLVTQSIKMGATLLTGGKHSGNYYQATVLSNVTNDMPIAAQEIFGPVAPIIIFDDEDEVLRLANDTQYGLAAYCYTNNFGRVWRMSEKLEFGMVGINEGIISNPAAPFGGVKQSGTGREGSKYGLDDYMQIKYVCIGGI